MSVLVDCQLLLPGPLDANITSELFWPALVKGDCDDIKPPKSISDLMTEYSNVFSEIRAPRKLRWKPHIGTVEKKTSCLCVYLLSCFGAPRSLCFGFGPWPLAGDSQADL